MNDIGVQVWMFLFSLISEYMQEYRQVYIYKHHLLTVWIPAHRSAAVLIWTFCFTACLSMFLFTRADPLWQFMVSEINLPQSWQTHTLLSSSGNCYFISLCTSSVKLWTPLRITYTTWLPGDKMMNYKNFHKQPFFLLLLLWLFSVSLASWSTPLFSSACNDYMCLLSFLFF